MVDLPNCSLAVVVDFLSNDVPAFRALAATRSQVATACFDGLAFLAQKKYRLIAEDPEARSSAKRRCLAVNDTCDALCRLPAWREPWPDPAFDRAIAQVVLDIWHAASRA